MASAAQVWRKEIEMEAGWLQVAAAVAGGVAAVSVRQNT